MVKFVTFVDGSNLDGVLKHLNLHVDDYGAFYRHVFEQSVHYWGRTFAEGADWPTAQHSRIYWYVVGKMDEWDLNDPKAEARLRARFEMNPRLRDAYIEDVSRRSPELPADRRIEEAWNLCFSETRDWYDNKRRASNGRSGSTTEFSRRLTSSRSAKRATGRWTCCTTRSMKKAWTRAWRSIWWRCKTPTTSRF